MCDKNERKKGVDELSTVERKKKYTRTNPSKNMCECSK